MSGDLTIARQASILAGLGGLILMISISVLVITVIGIFNGSIGRGNSVEIVILCLAGIIIGGALLAASLRQARPKRS